MSELRFNKFEVVFSDKDGRDYAEIEIFVGDLKVVRSSDINDEDILKICPSIILSGGAKLRTAIY